MARRPIKYALVMLALAAGTSALWIVLILLPTSTQGEKHKTPVARVEPLSELSALDDRDNVSAPSLGRLSPEGLPESQEQRINREAADPPKHGVRIRFIDEMTGAPLVGWPIQVPSSAGAPNRQTTDDAGCILIDDGPPISVIVGPQGKQCGETVDVRRKFQLLSKTGRGQLDVGVHVSSCEPVTGILINKSNCRLSGMFVCTDEVGGSRCCSWADGNGEFALPERRHTQAVPFVVMDARKTARFLVAGVERTAVPQVITVVTGPRLRLMLPIGAALMNCDARIQCMGYTIDIGACGATQGGLVPSWAVSNLAKGYLASVRDNKCEVLLPFPLVSADPFAHLELHLETGSVMVSSPTPERMTDGVMELHMRAVESGEIVGRVVGRNGVGCSDMPVTCRWVSGGVSTPPRTVLSGPHGEFRFSMLAIGAYVAAISGPAHVGSECAVVVESKSTANCVLYVN
jgi:hypothetical protein